VLSRSGAEAHYLRFWKDTGKRGVGFLIEDKPDEDGKVSGGIYEDRLQAVLLAVGPGPVGHEMPGAGARELYLDNRSPVNGDLAPGLEDDAPRVIGDLEDLLFAHSRLIHFIAGDI
jgi:hypothetical protein